VIIRDSSGWCAEAYNETTVLSTVLLSYLYTFDIILHKELHKKKIYIVYINLKIVILVLEDETR